MEYNVITEILNGIVDKVCKKMKKKERNKEYHKEYMKEYRLKNKEKIRERTKEDRLKNIDIASNYVVIKDFPEYTIDTTGRVFSKMRGIYLKACLRNGYLYVNLCKGNTRYKKTIHRLLVEHFIPNPNNYETCDHLNQIKTDCRLENLRWCNTRQNGQNRPDHSVYGYNIYKNKNGKFQVRFRNNKSKMIFSKTFKTLDEATEIRDFVNDNIKIYEHLNPWNLKGL